MKTPESITQHEPKYKANVWQDYTLQELGNWVHLFTKRAGHRSDPEKKAKDLADARDYHAMMLSHIEAAEQA